MGFIAKPTQRLGSAFGDQAATGKNRILRANEVAEFGECFRGVRVVIAKLCRVEIKDVFRQAG